jgi:CheY-like chemotaxis protein
MVDFTISDTGRGMTQDFLETIFDEYSQQAGTSTASSEVQKSTGLGMAILAKYVEMSGGTVRVESELDVGTTFFMSMPRRYNDGQGEDDELSKAIQNLKADSFVVMIDDDKNMHDMAKRTLGKAGINVIGAMDGETGLNVIRENKPALILLDVYMPGREGWSILSEIKADPELKDIPVCMVTQLNEQDYAKSLGANGYFTKPIDREVFVTEVLKLLDTKEGANQTILVIDDDANTRDLLKRILSEEGFDPQTAKDGVDGLETLDHLNTINKSPSLIVLDISMPRMDGFQFLDAYSDKVENDQQVPVIIFSGKDMTLTQREVLNNFENVIGIFAKGDLPNLASFIQQHRDDDGSENVEESQAS